MFFQDIQCKDSRNSVGDAILRALAVTQSSEVVLEDIIVNNVDLPTTHDIPPTCILEQLYVRLGESTPLRFGKIFPNEESFSDKPLASLYVVDKTNEFVPRAFAYLCGKKNQDTIGTIQYRNNAFIVFLNGQWGNSSELHHKRFLHPVTHEPHWLPTKSFNCGRALIRTYMTAVPREKGEPDLRWYPCSKHTIRSAFKFVLGDRYGNIWKTEIENLIADMPDNYCSDSNVPDNVVIKVGEALHSFLLTPDDISKPFTDECIDKIAANIGVIVAALNGTSADPDDYRVYFRKQLKVHYDM